MKRLLDNDLARVFSRELSWLAFNDRVLEEAADSTNPLLERLKFLSIVSSNLEEFFMVRVAQLYRKRADKRYAMRDEMPIEGLLTRIRDWVYDQKNRQARLFDEISYELSLSGLFIEREASDTAKKIFIERVLPYLTPITIGHKEDLPPIRGSQLYLLVRHKKSYSLLAIPPMVPRITIVKSKHVFLVDRLISIYRDLVFKKQKVEEIITFKISRDARIELDDETDDPLADIEEALRDRESGSIVRAEVDSVEMSESVRWLKDQLKVEDQRFYQLSLPLDLKAFMSVYSMKSFKKLKFAFPEPHRPLSLPAGLSTVRFFRALDKNDVLLHHPFTSFDPVVELVKNAASDPKVTRICQTLYRTSGNSPVLDALLLAAKNGKKVTVLVEIKARFDEANNVRWARVLKKAGAQVIFGTPEFKIHAKLTLVERKTVNGALKAYVHISTGNYHPRTARLYTDLGLLTTDLQYAQDARHLFDAIEAMDRADDYSPLQDPKLFAAGFKCWWNSPHRLMEKIIEWIDREAANARAGKPASIRAKMNGLVEHSVIEALYRASQAGVKIDLIVRGICCLRPGVKGLSENIRLRSIVDKYLEHSRVLLFENGGRLKVVLTSADWMPRNFFRRLEIGAPIRNPKIAKYLSETLWDAYNKDNLRARECAPDGHYRRVIPWGASNHRVQSELESMKIPEFPISPVEVTPKPPQAPSPASPSKAKGPDAS